MSKYRTAKARLRTRVWRRPGYDTVKVETRVEYEWGYARNAHGDVAQRKRVSGGSTRFALAEGDIGALAEGWDATFDLGAKVTHNTPASVVWTVDIEENGSGPVHPWIRGAVETLVRVAAHELRIPVSSCELQVES
jgi:hypothetical protein